MIIEILLLLIVLLLASLIVSIPFKFSRLINMAEQIENFLDVVDTPSPAMRKRDKVKQNLSLVNSLGKKQWTPELLDKATEKQLDNLLKKLEAKTPPSATTQSKSCSKDLLSKMSGVDNFQAMMSDINANFLIQNSTSELIGNVTGKLPSFTGNSPMEVAGSYMYEKCGLWLAPVSLFCTVFNHLDWCKFAEVAEQRQAQTKLQKDAPFPDEINGSRGESSCGESDKT